MRISDWSSDVCSSDLLRLFEGATRHQIAVLVDDVADSSDGDDVAVVCSHGDVIPILLDVLVAAGMEPERNLVWQKASVWVVERAGGAGGTGRYLPPPDRVKGRRPQPGARRAGSG